MRISRLSDSLSEIQQEIDTMWVVLKIPRVDRYYLNDADNHFYTPAGEKLPVVFPSYELAEDGHVCGTGGYLHSQAEAEILCDQFNIRDYGRVGDGAQ